MGPLVSKEQQERVERFIEIGQEEATLAMQGTRPSDARLANGYFVPPTVFADVEQRRHDRARGDLRPGDVGDPLLAVDEVVAMSNDNEYGLAAAMWTNDIKKAMGTARALRAGIVWINDTQPAPTEMPWGGYKQSGIGRELGKEGSRTPERSRSTSTWVAGLARQAAGRVAGGRSGERLRAVVAPVAAPAGRVGQVPGPGRDLAALA